MSIRPVEVQGSFPQSQKSGKIQEQLQQRGQTSQDVIAQQEKEEARKLRQQVKQSDESEQSRFHKDRESEQQEQSNQERKQKKQEEPTKQKHPYKGNFIDFSG
ncbi:hypothetical protein [Halalkalibacter sp. APA_J-10(15)]|uniref:hypothetical protein n=1 Tax=unclassified Halalkalibacter TaxID=2893063 RepID=UPI001FF5DC5F|nr:hypothetical protein [Halalkalibacter sp. APA_J-10(15)]MCK0470778.1 hypothetical protein [Halalkalibacter sp. APA_J-10(15)]